MTIFWIGPVMERVQEAILEERLPDENDVRELVEKGPSSIEEFVDAIDNYEGEAKIIEEKIEALLKRKKSREQAVKRMRNALFDILERHFNGKVKTATITVWNQDGTVRIRR